MQTLISWLYYIAKIACLAKVRKPVNRLAYVAESGT